MAIKKQFVQVHLGENVSESGVDSRKRAEFVEVKLVHIVQMGFISI